MIPDDNHFAIMAALFAIAALAILAEKTRIGALLSGAIVAVLLLDLSTLATGAAIDPSMRAPAIAGLFTSTYIGGSVNYAALGEITQLREDASFFSAATATDNLFSAVYLALLAIMPAWRWLAQRYTACNHD